LGPGARGEGKETDTVELLEPQDHNDDEEEDYSWVRFFFFFPTRHAYPSVEFDC
jgi:hypothetical protein